jgi:hypothetical protein
MRDSDSLAVDSLGNFELEQEVELDNDGNAIVKPQEPANAESERIPTNSGEATEPKKKVQPQMEDIYL